MTEQSTSLDRLRYVASGRVENHVLNLGRVSVETADRVRLGSLAGFVIDPVTRRLRFLVVESWRWFTRARRLVPFSLARLDSRRRALFVQVDGDVRRCCPVIPARTLRQLSSGGDVTRSA